jgi:hypothetical protein
MEKAYIVKSWIGPPKIYELRIIKTTANLVKCKRSAASGFNCQFSIVDFEKFYSPTPEAAIAKWRDQIAEHIVDLNHEADELREQLKTTPPMDGDE